MDNLKRATAYERANFAALWPGEMVLGLAGRSFPIFRAFLARISPAYLEWAGRWSARRAHYRALRQVPAYAELAAASQDGGPVTDKKNYIDPFPLASRCLGGRLPMLEAAMDESSGSTGRPYNWVRGRRERLESHQLISYFGAYCFGRDPFITLNAFSQGAWAHGLNLGLALQKNSLVKNTGPDVDKVLHTLLLLGPGRPFLIAGYPPLLKHVLDTAMARGMDLKPYRLWAWVGGEGMSEGLRDYLGRAFEKVYSGYGATDLEIGLAGETPLSVALRRLAHLEPSIKEGLFGSNPRMPMVFQYNPLMHHVEVSAQGELIFTVSRPSLVSPKIRYNIHDEGGVMRYDQMRAALASLKVDLDSLTPGGPRHLRLPFLWVYGRKDYTISVMGANIYPEDLEHCIYGTADLAAITRSFCMGLSEGPHGAMRPCFSFEVSVEPSERLADHFRELMLEGLTRLNLDFRAARQEFPEIVVPEIELYRAGEGPFVDHLGRVKQVRILKH